MNEKTHAKENGQSLVLVAAAMVILVLFVAITVDVSSAYYSRRTAQNAADGAALAGMSRLATQINNKRKLDDQIQEEMNDFAERNGIADTDDALANHVNGNVHGYYVDMEGNRLSGEPMVGAGSVPSGAYGIEAICDILAPTYFGGIFGLDGLSLDARAVSLLKQACGSDCVVPITTDASLLFEPGHFGEDGYERWGCFNIWRESQNDEPTPGLYGWVNWTWQEAMCEEDGDGRPCPEVDQGVNACNSPVLADNLDPTVCASGFIDVGDWMSSTSGVVNADDVRCLLDYYLGIPHDLGDCGASSDVQHEFTIPVYITTTMDLEPPSEVPCLGMKDPYDPTSGGLHYRVIGFARMQLLGYQLSQGAGVVNVGHSGEGCVTVGETPHNGNRITAEFREYVTHYDSSSKCYDPSGTLLSSPRLTE